MDICVPSLAVLVSAILVLSCGQNHRQTDRQTDRQTESHIEADA